MAPPQHERPPTPRPLDLEIGRHHGSTAALDLTEKSLRAAKAHPTPTLKQMVESLSRENGRLRAELVYRQAVQESGEVLQQDLDYITDCLKMAVMKFKKAKNEAEKDFAATNASST